MKKLFKTFSMLLAAVAMIATTSCNDDLGKEQTNQKPSTSVDDGEGVYMALEILMPNAGSVSGRSSTNDDGTSNANPGTEVGSNEENKVKSVAVVLAKKDNTFITYGLVYTDRITSKPNTNSYESVAKFSKADFEGYYKAESFEQEINVFVFCNPTADLLTKLNALSFTKPNTEWVNEACEVKAGNDITDVNTSIWADNSFLMSNASIATRLLPKEYDDWDNYRKPDEAFNLSGVNMEKTEKEVNNLEKGGAIKVERAVARLDYKDGSKNQDRTYDVLTSMKTDANGNITDGPSFIKVELGRMCLVNMSNLFYYLPRVSDNGLATGATLCGLETSKNYVVGPYNEKFNNAATELEQNPEGYGYADYFNYPFFNSNGKLDGDANYNRWFTSNIDDILGGSVMDNWNNKQDYHVWRYVTENVIPGVPNQKNGISTGIVFKAKIKADASILAEEGVSYPDAEELVKYLNNVGDCLKGDGSDPFLYMFSNRLFLKWEAVREAVKKECVVLTYTTDKKEPDITINSNTPLYIAVYGQGGMGDVDITYKYYENGEEKEATMTYHDPRPYDTTCADAMWTAWDEGKRPLEGKLIDDMRAAVTGRVALTGSGDSESSITNTSVGGFTIYQSSTDPKMGKGYYCYYYYWNRHNDNGKSGDMGPMEFAIVRNNVYKLSVSLIARLGHPMFSDNDPEPPTPDTDDEIDDIYLKVTCDVLPWVVRVNEIEFK